MASTSGAKGILIGASALILFGMAAPRDSRASSGGLSSSAGAICSKGNSGRGASDSVSPISSSLFFSFINIIYLLAIGIFLMRFSGQGLMSHTSTTTISRFFEKSRGKALSTIWFGLSTAEFILPVLITYFFLIYSWRTVWLSLIHI